MSLEPQNWVFGTSLQIFTKFHCSVSSLGCGKLQVARKNLKTLKLPTLGIEDHDANFPIISLSNIQSGFYKIPSGFVLNL